MINKTTISLLPILAYGQGTMLEGSLVPHNLYSELCIKSSTGQIIVYLTPSQLGQLISRTSDVTCTLKEDLLKVPPFISVRQRMKDKLKKHFNGFQETIDSITQSLLQIPSQKKQHRAIAQQLQTLKDKLIDSQTYPIEQAIEELNEAVENLSRD